MSWRDEAYELVWAAMSLPALAILGAREALAGLRTRGAEPTYEEAVAKVLEEGGDVYGRTATVGTEFADEEGELVLHVYGEYAEGARLFINARNAARAFVAIEKGSSTPNSRDVAIERGEA